MISDQPQESEEVVRIFVGDTDGPEQYVGFFEDDGETGYLYVSDRQTNRIVHHLQVYGEARNLDITEEDVQVVWSSDGSKCGILIWGRLRGAIDVNSGMNAAVRVTGPNAPGISDPRWQEGFERYLASD